VEHSVGRHPAKLDRDPVSRDIVADVVEDDLRPAASVQNDARRRDKKVADASLRRRRGKQQGNEQRGAGRYAEQGHSILPTGSWRRVGPKWLISR